MAQTIDGVLETTIDKWEDLLKFTKYFSDDLGFIFRGQSDSEWPLVSTLERFLNKLRPELKNNSVYSEHLQNFKESLRGRGINHLNLDDNELWALGQHYGLFTPLLDWTYSFHIALYFAFIDDFSPKKELRSIYAIHKKSTVDMSMTYNNTRSAYDKIELIESMSNENPRIINQAGLFTKIPFNFNLQQWFTENFKGTEDPAYFFKINVPNNQRMRILKELSLMNINPKTIFPDLNGSSLNCNLKLLLLADKADRTILK